MSKQWVGKEEKITVDGVEYTIAKPDESVRAAFTRWAAPQLRDPLEAIGSKLASMDPRSASILADAAVRASRSSYDFLSPEIQAMAGTEAGSMKLIEIMLQKHQPKITPDEAKRVWAAIAEKERIAREEAEEKGNSFRSDS